MTHTKWPPENPGRFTTSGVGVLATYAYDNLGRRTSLSRGNGTSAAYSYDNASRLSQLVEDVGGTSHDQTLGFSYNPASQISSTTRSNDAFAYTARVNINRTDTINGLNQVTATGGSTVTYTDNRGNITAIGGASYSYTSENMMTSAPSTTLSYDPLLRLYQAVESSATTRFAYDGISMIAEYDGTPSLQRRFVHGAGVDEPIVWYEGTGTSDRRFLHADERGSIVAVSNSSGTVTNVNSYDEYGMPASGNVGRLQYTGQAWIGSASVYHYRARIYNPDLGRFMQTDPIGYDGGMNLYAYVGNDPVNQTDPTGMWGDRCITTGSHICQKKNYICSSCSGSSTAGFGGSSGQGRGGGGTGGPASYGSSSQSGEFIRRGYELWKHTGKNEAGFVTKFELRPTEMVSHGFFALASFQAQLGASEYDIARRIAEQEVDRTRRIAPGRGRNTVYDAERHARWSYRMARQIGSDAARRFGTLHEVENLFEGGPLREIRMDMWNNNVGVQAYLNGEPIPDITHPRLWYPGGPFSPY